MHKKRPLAPSVTPMELDLCEPARHSFDSAPRRPQESEVLTLPPERDGVTANIRTINRQCFLMLCDTHRGLLSKLLPVPTKLVQAARSIITTGATGSRADLWTATLTYYVGCLLDARSQIAAAAKLHGLAGSGGEALKAITILEASMPRFLRAASSPASNQEALQESAERLGKSSMALTESLSELLRAVESATERARNLDHPETP